MPAKIDETKCTGCGNCISECPSEAIVMENGCAKVIVDNCIDCGVCIDSCPIEAISME